MDIIKEPYSYYWVERNGVWYRWDNNNCYYIKDE